MKKLLLVLLAAILTFSIVGVVSADSGEQFVNQETIGELPGDETSVERSTKITLALEESYQVTIPADFDFNDNAGVYTATTSVTAVVHLLSKGDVLTVTMRGTNNPTTSYDSTRSKAFTLETEADDVTNKQLAYAVKRSNLDTDTISSSDQSGWYASGANIISVSDHGTHVAYLHFLLLDQPKDTVTYTDTLVFTVDVSAP